jgi:hypothetical protein
MKETFGPHWPKVPMYYYGRLDTIRHDRVPYGST